MGFKKIFSGGPTPKPEVELEGDEEGVCRAWKGVSDSEKISENSQGLLRYFGSKKNLWRQLAKNPVVRFSPNLGDLKGALGRINEPKISEIVGIRFCIIGGQKVFFRGPYPQIGSRNGRGAKRNW